MFQLPAEFLNDESQQAMVGPQNMTVDNKVWMTGTSLRGIYRHAT